MSCLFSTSGQITSKAGYKFPSLVLCYRKHSLHISGLNRGQRKVGERDRIKIGMIRDIEGEKYP